MFEPTSFGSREVWEVPGVAPCSNRFAGGCRTGSELYAIYYFVYGIYVLTSDPRSIKMCRHVVRHVSAANFTSLFIKTRPQSLDLDFVFNNKSKSSSF